MLIDVEFARYKVMNKDIVINGMGFVKITDKALVDVYIDKNVEIFVRDSLI